MLLDLIKSGISDITKLNKELIKSGQLELGVEPENVIDLAYRKGFIKIDDDKIALKMLDK